jgi:WhiB family redox-sensing transcriptional regulator
MRYGACRDTDTNIFFPDDGHPSLSEPAKQICHSCIHETECLLYALENHIVDGVWGGTTGRERRRILNVWMLSDERLAVWP